jgi:hypothetical protein
VDKSKVTSERDDLQKIYKKEITNEKTPENASLGFGPFLGE